MEYQTITVADVDGYAQITLNRPDVKNALNKQMRAELLHAIKAAGNDARAIVLTGAGDAFCSGQDLSDGKKSVIRANLERTLRDEYVPLLRAIFDCKVPTISAVNGAAAGAGANLALAADIVIASESASFLQAFARIGLIPDAGGTYWLPRQMGFAKAMGAALFGWIYLVASFGPWANDYNAMIAPFPTTSLFENVAVVSSINSTPAIQVARVSCSGASMP